jgi:hypothetical protein
MFDRAAAAPASPDSMTRIPRRARSKRNRRAPDSEWAREGRGIQWYFMSVSRSFGDTSKSRPSRS